jgi:hypothetical protein
VKARFVVIKAHKGFYVVTFNSPKEFYGTYLPVFQAVLDSFKPLYQGGLMQSGIEAASITSCSPRNRNDAFVEPSPLPGFCCLLSWDSKS